MESTEVSAQLILEWHEELVHVIFDKFVVGYVCRCAGNKTVDTFYTKKNQSSMIQRWSVFGRVYCTYAQPKIKDHDKFMH